MPCSTSWRDPIAARRCGFADRVLALVTNRLTAPRSEHALAQWLETDFICDRYGRRFIAAWRDEEERKGGAAPRVRVASRQLQH